MEALLDAIYSAALDIGRWPSTLEALSTEFGCCAATLFVTDPLNTNADITVATGLFADPRVQDEYRKWFGRDPGLTHFSRMRTGTIAISSRLWTVEERQNIPFHQEFYSAAGFFDTMCASLQQGGGRLGLLALIRGHGEPEFNDLDAKRYLALVPHLQRSLQLHGSFSGRLRRGDSLAAMMERLACGTIFIDKSRSIWMMNAAARSIVERGDGLSLRNQRLLVTKDAKAAGLFAQFLDDVLAEVSPGPGGQVLVRRAADQLPYGMTISPLPRRLSSFDGLTEQAALVVINEASQASDGVVAHLAAHFSLTPSEAALLLTLMQGGSLREHAAARNVSLHTARFHMKGLFTKTGSRSQANLVRLGLVIAGSMRTVVD